jgi:predicted nucleotidyltransferase
MWENKNLLKAALGRIEITHKVQILHVVELGSRAWGLDNEDSDTDVGFIYVRAPQEYFKINQGHRDSSLQENRDTIETQVAGFGDLCGYDVSKACGMAYLSNPTLCDWLRLPSMYEDECVEELRRLMFKGYSTLKLRQLNIATAKRNFKTYVVDKTHVPVKKYLEIVRPLLNAIWYERTSEFSLSKEFPPYKYMELCNVAAYDHDFLDACITLYQQKKAGRVMIERLPRLDRIIELNLEKPIPKGLVREAPSIEEFDATFAKIVMAGMGPTHCPWTVEPPWHDWSDKSRRSLT